MKKRILALLLATLLLLLPLASCQGGKDNAATDASTEVDPTTEPTTAPTTEPTSEPTQEPTSEPTTGPQYPPVDPPVDDPTKAPVAPTLKNPSTYSGTPNTAWYTGDKTEYVLTSADQLFGFHSLRSETCTFEGVTIKLACDVIFNPGTTEEIKAKGDGNYEWKEINSAHQFKGVFDGQGHTISGIYMQLGGSAVRGMFGGIGGNAEIKNFTLINSYFGGPNKDGKATLGGIAAKVHADANVKISNVTVFAVLEEGVSKFKNVGGFIGSVEDVCSVTLENCKFIGSVTVTGENAGGMIGLLGNKDTVVTLKNCYNYGTISATQCAGGLVGQSIATSVTVTDCANYGTVTAEYDYNDLVGGSLSVAEDPTGGARPATPDGKTALRVMSFNVQVTLPKTNGLLTAAAQNRIEAVTQEILFYSPDLIGFQEDSMTWHSSLKLDGYNRILNSAMGSATTEKCAIYYKKGLTLLNSGTTWLTASGTGSGVALTVADLTTEGSKYKLSDADLAELGITKDSPDSVLTESRKYNDTTSYTLLGNRMMTWGVFDINGQTVIYINTHLQHRSQNAAYSTQAIQNIRSMERVKSFDILQQKLAELKKTYPDAVDFITGDFNDLVHTAIYNAACIDYGYSSAHQSAAERYGVNGSWNNAFNIDKQGDNYPSAKEGTSSSYLDYCFVSKGIDVLKFRVGAGKAEITAVDGSKKTIYTSDHLPIITDLCFATSTTDSPVDPDHKEEVDDDPSKPSVYSGVYDTSWYTGNKTEYVLTTADQLVGMVYLRSETVTFEGVTIKLARDVIINEGPLEEIIAKGETNYGWRPLNSSHLFKGTFDGQGHVISGVYLQLSNTGNRSMFGGVGGNAVIKDFKLENSYFGGPTVTGKENLACIVTKIVGADANVTISDITVGSTVLIKDSGCSMGAVSGFVGTVEAGNLTMTNCSFEGKIDFVFAAHVGGLIGKIKASATVTLNDCTNKGDLIAKRNCGGLIGCVITGYTLINNNSTSTGTITCAGLNGELIGAEE